MVFCVVLGFGFLVFEVCSFWEAKGKVAYEKQGYIPTSYFTELLPNVCCTDSVSLKKTDVISIIQWFVSQCHSYELHTTCVQPHLGIQAKMTWWFYLTAAVSCVLRNVQSIAISKKDLHAKIVVYDIATCWVHYFSMNSTNKNVKCIKMHSKLLSKVGSSPKDCLYL